MKSPRQRLVAFLILMIGLAILFATRSEWEQTDPRLHRATPGGEGIEVAPFQDAEASGSDLVQPDDRRRSAATLDAAVSCEIRVVDSMTSAPIDAWLEVVDSRSAAIIERLHSPAGPTRMRIPDDATSLVCSSPGYRTARHPAQDVKGDALVIELDPSERSALVFTSVEGAPMSGIDVQWYSADTSGYVERPEAVASGVTDEMGRCTTAIATPAVGRWRTTDGLQGTTTLVPIGGERHVVVDTGSATELHFVDALAGTPRAGYEFRLHDLTRSSIAGAPLIASQRGVLRIESGQRPIRLELIVDSDRIDRVSGAESVQENASAAVIYCPPGSPAATPIIVHVATCGLTIRCVDGTDGDPIAGVVRHATSRQNESGVRRVANFAAADALDGGMVTLPCWDLPSFVARGADIVLWPSGYRPRLVDVERELMAVDGSFVELEFEPVASKLIRVVDRDGRPYRGELLLERSIGLGRDHRETRRPDESGILGPLEWMGGPIRMWAPGSSVGLGTDSDRRPAATVPAAKLEASDRLEVTIDRGGGMIRVLESEEPLVPLIARHESGAEVVGEMSDAGDLVFHDAPSGRYLVGPRRWVDQIWSRRFYGPSGLEVRVEPGSTVDIVWDPRWSARTTITGRVRVDDGLEPRLFLYPVYGTATVRTGLGLRVNRLELAPGGDYAIPAGDPVPELIGLCMVHDDTRAPFAGSLPVVVLDAFAPGDSVDVSCRELVLELADGLDLGPDAFVKYALPVSRFHSAAGQIVFGWLSSHGSRRWRGQRTVRIGGVPSSVESLECVDGTQSKTIALEVDDGTPVRLVFDGFDSDGQ